jgi:hypothetical protein
MIDHIIVSVVVYFLYKHISKDNYTNEQAIMFVVIMNLAYHVFFMNKVRMYYREKFDGNTISTLKQEQMAALERELTRLRNESAAEAGAALTKAKDAILMNNSQPFITPPPPPATSTDSCNCDAKVESIIDKYMKKKSESDMQYNQLTPEQMQPLGSYDNTFTNKWDHGFTYLNTSKWAPPQRNSPVCKTEAKCPVCPVTTAGYPVGVLEYDESRKVMPPDNINVNYIKDQLNN